MRHRTPYHYLVLVLAIAAPTVALVVGWMLAPDERGFGTHEQLGLPACQMRARFDIPCPACGVTTAVTHFAHGELLESLRVQPFGFLLAALSVVCGVLALVAHFMGRDLWLLLRRMPQEKLIVIAALALLVAWGWTLL